MVASFAPDDGFRERAGSMRCETKFSRYKPASRAEALRWWLCRAIPLKTLRQCAQMAWHSTDMMTHARQDTEATGLTPPRPVAILVKDLETIYWNKGRERIYGGPRGSRLLQSVDLVYKDPVTQACSGHALPRDVEGKWSIERMMDAR